MTTTINITKGTANPYYRTPTDSEIGDTFQHNRQMFLAVTPEQGASFERVVRHQGRENYQGAYYDHLSNYLAVTFKGIFIGIETDGYAHS